MRIAICRAYTQEFYVDVPKDIQEGDTIFVQYAKDKKCAAQVVAIGEYSDDDKAIKILLEGRQKKMLIGKITILGGTK